MNKARVGEEGENAEGGSQHDVTPEPRGSTRGYQKKNI